MGMSENVTDIKINNFYTPKISAYCICRNKITCWIILSIKIGCTLFWLSKK